MTDPKTVSGPVTPSSARPETAILVNRCAVRLWNLTQEERLRRLLARVGIVDVRSEGEMPSANRDPIVLVRTDFFVEESLIQALVRTPGCLLAAPVADGFRSVVAANTSRDRAAGLVELLRQRRSAPEDLAAVGLAIWSPAQLATSYNHALRKRAAPCVMSLSENIPIAVERRTFHAAYKGVTDFVTKWLWPWPAFWVTRWCATRGISPNLVTAASLVLVLLATWMFAGNHFAFGLVAAWLMTFLDTVDGKLARVTLTSTKFGNIFDHGIDLVHPPFWYLSWYFGLSAGSTQAQTLLLGGATWVIVIGYIVGRIQEGFFLWRYHIEIHAWRPIDSAFRLITARRNPNLAIMTAAVVAGRPDVGLQAVAVWTILSLLFHSLRIGQAIRRRRAGETIRTWLEESPTAA